jgi:Squalene-hopene cyclase C-terminal domain
VSYTTFGVLALRASGVSAGKATVRWLVSAQNEDGGFGLAPAATSDSDMTGATLQALAAVGRARSASARRAIAWLRTNQNDDGGFGQFRGRSSNAQSTAYAVQGLVAAKVGGRPLSRALAYLRGLQRRDGSVAYSSSSGQTPVWVTAQALMALERKPLPLAAVPRAERRPAREASREPERQASEEPAPPASSGGGDGRESPPADSPTGESVQSDPAPPDSTEDEPIQSIPSPSDAPEPEAAPTDGGLRLDPARREPTAEPDGGIAGWVVVPALLATAGLLFLLRRRLLPSKLRRLLPRRRSVG